MRQYKNNIFCTAVLCLCLSYSSFSNAKVVHSYYDQIGRLIVHFVFQKPERVEDIRQNITQFYEQELQKHKDEDIVYTHLKISTSNCEIAVKSIEDSQSGALGDLWNWMTGPDPKLMEECYKEHEQIQKEMAVILTYLSYIGDITMCGNDDCRTFNGYQKLIPELRNKIAYVRSEIQKEQNLQASVSRQEFFISSLSLSHQSIQAELEKLKEYIESRSIITKDGIRGYIRQMKMENTPFLDFILEYVENISTVGNNEREYILNAVNALVREDSYEDFQMQNLDRLFENTSELIYFISLYKVQMESSFIEEWIRQARKWQDNNADDSAPSFASLVDELEAVYQSKNSLSSKIYELFLFKHKSPYFQQCRQWLKESSMSISRTRSFIPYHLSVFLQHCFNAENFSSVDDFIKYERDVQAYLKSMQEHVLLFSEWTQNVRYWLDSEESKQSPSLTGLVHQLESHLELKTMGAELQDPSSVEDVEPSSWTNFFQEIKSKIMSQIFYALFGEEIEKFNSDDEDLLSDQIVYFKVRDKDSLTSLMSAELYLNVLMNIDDLAQLYSELKNNLVLYFNNTPAGQMHHFLKNSREATQKRIYVLERELRYLEDMVQFSQNQMRLIRNVYETAGRDFGLKNPQNFYQLPLLKFCYQLEIIGDEELQTFYTELKCS